MTSLKHLQVSPIYSANFLYALQLTRLYVIIPYKQLIPANILCSYLRAFVFMYSHVLYDLY